MNDIDSMTRKPAMIGTQGEAIRRLVELGRKVKK
jgi:hypothetical protein